MGVNLLHCFHSLHYLHYLHYLKPLPHMLLASPLSSITPIQNYLKGRPAAPFLVSLRNVCGTSRYSGSRAGAKKWAGGGPEAGDPLQDPSWGLQVNFHSLGIIISPWSSFIVFHNCNYYFIILCFIKIQWSVIDPLPSWWSGCPGLRRRRRSTERWTDRESRWRPPTTSTWTATGKDLHPPPVPCQGAAEKIRNMKFWRKPHDTKVFCQAWSQLTTFNLTRDNYLDDIFPTIY